MLRHHPAGFSCGVRTACKTSLRSSQKHAVLAHRPRRTPSWLRDSLRTPRGTAWLGVPGGGTCHTAMQEATGHARHPAASRPDYRSVQEVVRVRKQGSTEPAGMTVLLAFIRAAPAVRPLPRVASIAQEGLQDLGHSPQGLQGLPSTFQKALSTSKGVLK